MSCITSAIFLQRGVGPKFSICGIQPPLHSLGKLNKKTQGGLREGQWGAAEGVHEEDH